MEKKYFLTKLKTTKDSEFEFVLNAKTVDRDGEVILPEGVILPQKENLPVLFQHGRDVTRGSLPIGRLPVRSIKITDEKLIGTIILDEGSDFFAQLVAEKIRLGSLDAGSIGFMPLEMGEPILPGQTGQTIKRWELLEFSITPVGSNREALRREFDAALKMKDFYQKTRELSPILDDLKRRANKLSCPEEQKLFQALSKIHLEQLEMAKDCMKFFIELMGGNS